MTNKDVFTPYEKFVFLEKISKYSVIFKSVYELGNAQYSNQIETQRDRKRQRDRKSVV